MTRKYSKLFVFLIFNIIFLFVIYHGRSQLPFISYVDEFLGVLGFIMIFYVFYKKGFTKKDFWVFILCSIINCFYIFYSIYNSLQPITTILTDFVACSKFFFAIYLFSSIFKGKLNKDSFIWVVNEAKIITVIYILLTLAFYFFGIFPIKDYRYGLPVLCLFYPTITVFASSLIFLLLLIYAFVEKKRKYIYLTLLSLMLVLTLRSKAITFIIAFWSYLIYIKLNSKVYKNMIIVIGALLAIYLCFDQFIFYFVTLEDSARSQLYSTSFIIAKDYFPFGTGFGSFASASSANPYSPIYYYYGLSSVYGLTPDHSSFISDSFWPMILGQFGYFGLIFYVFILCFVVRKIMKFSDYKFKNLSLLCFLYLFIDSLVESSFVHPISILFAFLIGISFSQCEGDGDLFGIDYNPNL